MTIERPDKYPGYSKDRVIKSRYNPRRGSGDNSADTRSAERKELDRRGAIDSIRRIKDPERRKRTARRLGISIEDSTQINSEGLDILVEAYIRANAQLSFVIAEGNKANKAKKNAYIRSRGGRDNAPQGVYSDQEVYADNPHGSDGSMRGVRIRGAKPSNDQIKTHRLGLKRNLQAKHRKDESTMNQEKFEEAYIRSNAQLAFVIAEALKTMVVARSDGGTDVKKLDPKTGKTTKTRTITDPKRAANIRRAAEKRVKGERTFGRKPNGEEFSFVHVPEREKPTQGN